MADMYLTPGEIPDDIPVTEYEELIEQQKRKGYFNHRDVREDGAAIDVYDYADIGASILVRFSTGE